MRRTAIHIIAGCVGAAVLMLVATAQTFPTLDSLNRNAVSELQQQKSLFPSADSILESWHAPLRLPDEPEDDTDAYEYGDLAQQMGDYAAKYLGVRYRLGATGPKAFDCSAFMAHIYKNFGLTLNRTSRAQYTQGDKVALEDVKPGDLLFFSGRRVSKTVGHVGMVTSVDPVTGEVEMIHASSSKGISKQKFPDHGYFSRRFIGARRMLGTAGFTPKS